MQNEEESAFSAITRLPIVPFSAFLNDLNRPFFLDNLHPSAEIVRTGVNFPETVQAPEKIPTEMFNCASFNPSKILLNVPPVKEITHEYDEFMLKVLEDCYQVQNFHVSEAQMTVPKPAHSTPVKSNAPKSVQVEAISTPMALKVKLNVASGSADCSQLLKKLVTDGSFVNPLCFDCEEDLNLIVKVIRSYAIATPNSNDLEIFESLTQTLSKYIEEINEHLDQSSESLDSKQAIYCISLIGLLNVGRLSAKEALKDYSSFDSLMRFYSFCSGDLVDSVLSAVIESYVAILNKFTVHDSEISSYSSHIFSFCFESPGPLTKITSIVALSQVFAKYSEYRTYILDQLLMKSTDDENIELQKLGSIVIMSCLQALCVSEGSTLALMSSFMTSCLSYCWKGEGNELPKGTNVFFLLIEELQNIHSNYRWPIASTALSQCSIQMFHYLLKDESSNSSKGSLLLKMKFLDILANISHVVSSDSKSIEKRSFWQFISQSAWFSAVFSPEKAFECLNPSVTDIKLLDQDFYSDYLRLGPLSKIPERVTGLFIKLISSEVTQLRSKAIKNLFNLMTSSQLSKTNYDALKANILVKASDPSISVRDAALEFISKMIFSPLPHENGPKELLESVLSRIKDRGVSVRKRAVKIIGEFLQKGIADEKDVKLSCIGSLISHISDEEDDVVVEMIFKTLKENWIMNYLGNDFLKIMPAAQRKIMAAFADEVVNVIGFLQSDIKCLQDFLARFLKDESIKKDYSVFFSGTIEVLLENLLQTLEANDLKSLKRSLESISLFSESNPQSLENHLGLLQSLLRSEDSEISLLSMKLISGVVPRASLTELKKLLDFEKDLLNLIYRGSEVAVKLAIESLYHYVNNCSHQYALLSGLWQKFTDYLKLRMSDEEVDLPSVPHICRALLSTGVLCAQSARHREREFGLKDFHTSAQSRCLLEFVCFFAESPIVFIRSCTIQALGFLLLACPQISISSCSIVRSLISRSLNEAEEDSCKLKMLGIFDQMIKVFNLGAFENDNNSNSIAINNNTSKNNILAMEGDESYFSALIQEHLASISNCVICSESLEIQATALKVCSSSAILGLVNPQLIIPYLAIGLNSENDHIQAYSRSSYDRLLTRFPSLISKDLVTPGKLLYRQLKKTVDCNVVCGYTSSIGNVLTSRLAFYYLSLRGKTGKLGIEALNGVFTWFESVIAGKNDFVDLAGFNDFLIELLVTLPFSNSEEVLSCLQRIQGIFSMSVDCEDDALIVEKYSLLQGLSAAVNFLIKSFPQVQGMSIEQLGEEGMGSNNNGARTLQRITSIPLNLSKKEDTSHPITIELLQELVSKQASIPLLLSNPITSNNASSNRKRSSKMNHVENDDEDFDVSNFLVDDEEISESESDSDVDDFIDIESFEPVNKKKNQSVKKQAASKPANNKKQKSRR